MVRLSTAVILLPFAAVILLQWLVNTGQAQLIGTGVCTLSVARYHLEYQTQSTRYRSDCGSPPHEPEPCYRSQYRQVSVRRVYYSTALGCCSGYSECGSNRCCSVCNPPCVNGGACTGPDVCECLPGWTGDKCETDIDECSEGIDRCDQNCHNARGSYACSCDSGYRLNGNGLMCNDINECNEVTDGCQQECINTNGSYTCACRSAGYRLRSDGRGCIDVNECAEGTNECDEQCYNTNGSYSCNCTGPGYRLNQDGLLCDDINECNEMTDGCQQECVNTDGSYTCACRSGYRLSRSDGHGCIDIDECSEGIDGCEQNCHNAIGSYACSCDNGYHLSQDKVTCNGNINQYQSSIVLGYSIGGGGGLLFLTIMGVVIIVIILLKRRTKSKKAKHNKRQDAGTMVTNCSYKSKIANPVYRQKDEDKHVYEDIY